MKKLITSIVICLLAISVQAQDVYNSSGRVKARKPEKESGFDPDKLIFGGGLGLWFGTITDITIAPVVGYRFSDNFSAGLSLGYSYYRYKNFMYYENLHTGATEYWTLKQNFYTASLWGRYIFYDNIFGHLEIEANMHDYYDGSGGYDMNTGKYSYYSKKVTSPALLVGGGFKQPVSERTSLTMTVLYDALQDKYSPYRDRLLFRIGFLAGF